MKLHIINIVLTRRTLIIPSALCLVRGGYISSILNGQYQSYYVSIEYYKNITV